MWAGLLRMGWVIPTLAPTLPTAHGPLMICGFLGALIGIERAVALRLNWGYLSPILTLAGSALLLLIAAPFLGVFLIFAGSLLLTVLGAVMLRRQLALHTAIISMGALSWLVGNAIWLAGQPVFQAVPWWIGFMVLTIAGERLELSRVLRLTRLSTSLFIGAVAIFIGGMLPSVAFYEQGSRLLGLGMIFLAIWLLRYDIARRTIRRPGLTRFIAISLLSGYIWLAVGGFLALMYGGVTAGPMYDAMLHAVLLGFVFSMIFAHAPIIFPAVLERPLYYSPSFYAHLILLQLSLLLRIISDMLLWPLGRRWGGMLNVLVLLLFLMNTVWSLRRGAGHRESAHPAPSGNG